MQSQELRERFLRFFEARGHHRLPSASLIPHDDPSLLFTVAGMVPLKRYLSGEEPPPSPRLASCQKCFRGSGLLHDDIASVGDSSHHTFFEMLGNWSIGDYFKRETIAWAWEFLTGELQIAPDRLWPSIYPDDAASLQIWTADIGVADAKIARFEDNWWQAGSTGPCGYDSEIYCDLGSPCSCGRNDCRPQDECGGDRWVELWNLVFMEFELHEDGSRTPLPAACVDTGMGLERLTTVIQGKRSVYETDLFSDVISAFRGRQRADLPPAGAQRSLNVLGDHLRGAAFLIADGVLPSNEGRGYVLRRVIRRAAIHGRRLRLEGGLETALPELVATMGGAYPELAEHQRQIAATLAAEEQSFARTIESGSQRLDALLDGGGGTISGADAFRLYDTYGLPIELTAEMAAERGVDVDREGFDRELAGQKAQSQKHARKVGFEGGVSLPEAHFVGYEELETEATVRRVGLEEEITELTPGQEAYVVIDPTPFYAEKGGQIGDGGELLWHGGKAAVVQSVYPGGDKSPAILVRVESGSLGPGQVVVAKVDIARRAQVARHHSATHLLHRALRDLLGETVSQRGSFVGPEYTTFDFNFPRQLSAAELAELEKRVNSAIRDNHARDVQELPIAEARKTGAVAIFGEKYGDKVRVVDFGGWARELCGGTHVDRTGDIGAAVIVSEESIGQGVRRITMLCGESAQQHWRQTEDALATSARNLRVPATQVPQRVEALLEQNRSLQKQLDNAKRAALSGGVKKQAQIEEIGGIKVATLLLTGNGDANALDAVADSILAEQLGGDGVVAVMDEGRFAVKVGAASQSRGVAAGELVAQAAAAMGGKGGGRADFARGGIKDPSRRDAGMTAIRQALAGKVGSAS